LNQSSTLWQSLSLLRHRIDEAGIFCSVCLNLKNMEVSTVIPNSVTIAALGCSVNSTQSKRNSSLASLIEDCPICLDRMEITDCRHILLCERKCGFNMCTSCIESLITSSKDDFQLASDGNMHVKVYLNCPNCRSHLSHSIRYTLLLRKVEELRCLNTPETEWTTSQVRLKRALDTIEVEKAVKCAKIMEADYFDVDFDEMDDEEKTFEDEINSEDYVEQWGLEVDLSNESNKIFVFPRAPSPTIREETLRVDSTLFAGLAEFLNDEERLTVTELMTCGETTCLVEAADTLFNVLQNLSNVKPSSLTAANRQTTIERRKKSICRRSSIFQLIADAEAARIRNDGKENKVSRETEALRNAQSRPAQQRQLGRELRIQADFQKRFPLPVRMPKAVKLDLSLPFDMELLDYTWGGTVLDAYSKISIGFGNKITQRRPNNVNIGNILGKEPNNAKSVRGNCALGFCVSIDDDPGDYRDIYIAMPGRSRVLVSHTGQIGKLGAVRGDVLTHVDGENVDGKRVAEVLEIIKTKEKQDFIMLTLNAELSVADALKRRASAIADVL